MLSRAALHSNTQLEAMSSFGSPKCSVGRDALLQHPQTHGRKECLPSTPPNAQLEGMPSFDTPKCTVMPSFDIPKCMAGSNVPEDHTHTWLEAMSSIDTPKVMAGSELFLRPFLPSWEPLTWGLPSSPGTSPSSRSTFKARHGSLFPLCVTLHSSTLNSMTDLLPRQPTARSPAPCLAADWV